MTLPMSWLSLTRSALLLLVWMTLLTGVVYPLVITGLGQLLFSSKANGSLVTAQQRVVGSRLIGQQFDEPQYFWGRPSATGAVPYNAAASSGSNLGPLNPALLKRIQSRIVELKKDYPGDVSRIPVDLVTASASGLDPHISMAAARWQVPRVAHARNIAPEELNKLIDRFTTPRQFGVLGEPVVNVLELNLALDQRKAKVVSLPHE